MKKRPKTCMYYKVQNASELITDECIQTPTGLDSYGYGQCRDGYTMRKAHTIAFEHSGKTVPIGMLIRHTCDNRACINPEHLLLGTHNENMQDMVKRGRSPTENQPLAVLTWLTVGEIRESTDSPEVLSERYGVRKQQIKRILKGEAWRLEN